MANIYNIHVSVDADGNFPQKVRVAVANSTEVLNRIKALSEPKGLSAETRASLAPAPGSGSIRLQAIPDTPGLAEVIVD